MGVQIKNIKIAAQNPVAMMNSGIKQFSYAIVYFDTGYTAYIVVITLLAFNGIVWCILL